MKFFNITEIKKYFCIMLLITSLSHHALSQNKPLIQLKDKGVSEAHQDSLLCMEMIVLPEE